MSRNIVPFAVVVALAIGTFLMLEERIGFSAVPCDVYLDNVQPPDRDDLTWPVYAHCYYVRCGIRL